MKKICLISFLISLLWNETYSQVGFLHCEFWGQENLTSTIIKVTLQSGEKISFDCDGTPVQIPYYEGHQNPYITISVEKIVLRGMDTV